MKRGQAGRVQNQAALLVVAPTRREMPRLASGQQAQVMEAVVGLGREAHSALDRLLARHRPSIVLSIGFAGALTPEKGTGDLVVCDSFRLADGSSPAMPADDAMVRLATIRLAQAQVAFGTAVLLTVPAPLLTVAHKRVAGQESGAALVDMEGYWLAQVAAQHQVPFVALRVVLDAMHHELPELVGAIVADQGRREWRHAARSLLRNPTIVARLIPLANRSWRSQRALHMAARVLAPTLVASAERMG